MPESYWEMRRASQGWPEALEELDRLCEEAHKPILQMSGYLKWNWWAVYPEITGPSIKRYCFWSGHKPEGDYIFVEIQPNWIMANVMKEAGLFPSASEARRNGWNKPIASGLNHIVYNQKRGIDVFTFGE